MKEKIKTIAAKAIKAFQWTEEYNTMLFSWYFKGFELLRWYFIKHPTGVDLENLDLEEVDKEMVADEAFQSTTPKGDASESAPLPPVDDNAATNAWTCYLCFFGCLVCFGPFFFFFLILISEQCFYTNLRTIFLPSVVGLLSYWNNVGYPLFLGLQLYQWFLYLLVFILSLHDT